MKTILLIRYAPDNLSKIHERTNIELFINMRCAFYQHPVDVKGPACVTHVGDYRPWKRKRPPTFQFVL